MSYDLFIAYTRADAEWVNVYLIPELNLPRDRIITADQFQLGASWVSEFERAVTTSRYTVLVLSPALIADKEIQFADQLAAHLSMITERSALIPLWRERFDAGLHIEFRVALDYSNAANWKTATARLRALVNGDAPTSVTIPCPYPGMTPFREQDVATFYGRDRETQLFVDSLHRYSFVAVIGPSGCGKSSLVFAGLIPKLATSALFGKGEWLIRTMRPLDAPMQSLAHAFEGDIADPVRALACLRAAHPGATRVLLIVDQFEEVFTLGKADAGAFQNALSQLIATENCYIVLTVRADFYPELMTSRLWQTIKPNRIEIAPLDADGLREAIQKPAHTARVFIEPALVERLVADAADQPGALPMVQETMVLLWERKRDRYISLDAYESLGDGKQTGLQAAMAYRADRALAMLTPRQRAIVFRILIRLVQFGEGRADTRRQQPVVALISADDARAEFDETLDRLIATRLIALNYVQARAVVMADLAHEALITGWSALDQWIKDHRDAELKRRRLDARAQEWIRLGRARAGLLDATETREARAWLASAHAQDLGGSDDLLALIKQSSRGFNPGFQPRGVGLLLVGFVELVALLGGVILFIQSSNATSSSQVAFWFTVVIILVLGTAMLTLTLRGERFLLQRLSYFLTRERRAPIALVGSFVVVAAIWGGLGVTLIAHERECNRRGFVRDARPHVAVIAPSIEPAYLQTFRRTFADASENFLTPERVTAEDWMQCSNFFSYRINLNRADGAVGEIVYVAELTFLKSGDTRPEIASDPGGGCNLIFALAHRVARRLDQDLDPNSDENPIPPGRLPNQCEPYERDAEGVRLLNDRLFADAENQFKQAIALAPEFTSPYVGLAQVYYQTNRASDAIAQLNRAISLAPSFYWRAENQLAIACYYSSDYKCAIDRYLKAIEVNNRNLEAYNNLAVVYLDAGQLDQAEIMLKRAEALVAQTRSRREAGLRYNVTKTRGILEFKLGKWSEAIRVLQIADQMQPKEFQELIVYYLALANANVSNPTQACTYLRRYEQIVPSGLVGEAERRADSLKRLAECR